MRKRAKHNLTWEKMNYVVDMSGKGEQRYERDSALAGRDQVSLYPLQRRVINNIRRNYV